MFLFSILAFAAVLIVLGVSAARGLRNLDDILEIVDTRDTDANRSALGAER